MKVSELFHISASHSKRLNGVITGNTENNISSHNGKWADFHLNDAMVRPQIEYCIHALKLYSNNCLLIVSAALT